MKKLFIAVFLLTVADAICTYAGVYTGFIEEANPLLQKSMMSQPALTAAAVCLCAGGLLWVMYRFRSKVRFMAPMILSLFLLKVAVLGVHAFWMVHVVFPT